jgi:hypothetical protein
MMLQPITLSLTNFLTPNPVCDGEVSFIVMMLAKDTQRTHSFYD